MGSDILIIPTDDERVKILTIPLDVIPREELEDSKKSLAEKVQNVLKQCKLVEEPTKEVFLPAFTKKMKERGSSILDEVQVGEGKQVKGMKEVAEIDI